MAVWLVPGAGEIDPLSNPDQAEVLVELARSHKLTGPLLVAVDAGALHLPADQVQRLVDEHEKAMLWCMRLETALLDVAEVFERGGVNFTLSVLTVCAAVSMALLALRRRSSLSSDALLGLLAHSALALGLVCLAFMTWVRIDLMGFLFGDILAVSWTDIAIIYGGGAAVLAVLAFIWRPLFASTVSRELAQAAGIPHNRLKQSFRSETGFAVYGYLQERRLCQARSLLLAGKTSVTEAALSVGYGSMSHFTALFRRRFGQTPSGIMCRG